MFVNILDLMLVALDQWMNKLSFHLVNTFFLVIGNKSNMNTFLLPKIEKEVNKKDKVIFLSSVHLELVASLKRSYSSITNNHSHGLSNKYVVTVKHKTIFQIMTC